MSLFPAYSKANARQIDENAPSETWLTNSSYKIDVPKNIARVQKNQTNASAELEISDNFTNLDSTHKRRKKEKRKLRKELSEKDGYYKYDVSDTLKNTDFSIDKSSEKVFLKVNTIARPSRPKYTCTCLMLGNLNRKRKKLKWKRYYKTYFDSTSKSENTDETPEENVATKTEMEMSKKTAYYNEILGREQNNIDVWLEYVRFQDTIWQFEKTYRRGSVAKGARVTAERKLAILDKALIHNPGYPALSRERVLVAGSVYPADELHKYLQGLVEKDLGNVILWQGYIESTQCSMAHCNAPAVIEMYNRCLTKLHQLRRATKVEKSLLEERILCMLYQCGLFLRQAGLWEQLWTLLRLYLELNLSATDRRKFNIQSKLDDQQLLELEEVVLNSQLPLHELWLRIERLRESCHWLPWNNSEPCEDPQRVIFVEELTDLIHPITCAGNTFRLTVMILTLLKAPLLLCRHHTIEQLGLDYVPWSLDTIESLLPAFYPVFSIMLSHEHLLKDATKLAVGPQYIKTHPGQEEYLEFLITTMRNSADCLESKEQTALNVWWLRFERLLIVLEKYKRFKMPLGRTKSVKSSIKEFLKDDKNRNNVVYYKEYALIEYELDNVANSNKILSSAIAMLCNKRKLQGILNEEETANFFSLYRTLVELCLQLGVNDESKLKALNYLIALANNLPVSDDIEVNESVIIQTTEKFEDLRLKLLKNSLRSLNVSEHFLPDVLTDLVICYGWLLYLTHSPFKAGKMVEDTIEVLNEDESNNLWRQEVLTEWSVGMIYKTCIESKGNGLYGVFREALHGALKLYPNNIHLLTLAAMEQNMAISIGRSWWTIRNLLSKSGHALPTMFLAVMANQQLSKIESDLSQTELCDNALAISTFSNRVLSLFSTLTKSDICTRRCGLLWRLYLQFLYSQGKLEACRNTYYSAVEECPWLKSLYIDAAIYIPAELAPIQDLLIEKQLRIHVTPEELDILRN